MWTNVSIFIPVTSKLHWRRVLAANKWKYNSGIQFHFSHSVWHWWNFTIRLPSFLFMNSNPILTSFCLSLWSVHYKDCVSILQNAAAPSGHFHLACGNTLNLGQFMVLDCSRYRDMRLGEKNSGDRTSRSQILQLFTVVGLQWQKHSGCLLAYTLLGPQMVSSETLINNIHMIFFLICHHRIALVNLEIQKNFFNLEIIMTIIKVLSYTVYWHYPLWQPRSIWSMFLTQRIMIHTPNKRFSV